VRVAVRDASLTEYAFERPLPVTGCALDLRLASPKKYRSLIFGTVASAVKTNSGSGT
jgi:hypothetical protein